MLLCCMKTIKDVFFYFKQSLNQLYDANELEALTLLTVAEISELSKAMIKAFPEHELIPQQIELLNNIITELKTGKPIQYIIGKTEFYGLTFKVNPSVLVPRPETEELVEWVISYVNSRPSAINNILDIGTGSGCIAISLKRNIPGINVHAIDISTYALQTAKENAQLNQVHINLLEADILNVRSESEIPKSEIIISNPPYVTLNDKTKMHTNVIDFEPHIALFVPENDPLIFYKAIAAFAIANLNPNGLLFLEINENYGPEIISLLTEKGFKNLELRKDMNGRERMIKATKIN